VYSPIFSDEIHIFLQDPRALTLVPSRTLADGCRRGFFITRAASKMAKQEKQCSITGSLLAAMKHAAMIHHLLFSGKKQMFRGFQDPPATIP